MPATPWGFRDILPEEALVREAVADTVRGVLRRADYLPVETPLLAAAREPEAVSTSHTGVSWPVSSS